MTKVFISHSTKDKDRLADFREHLEKDNVLYWVDDQGILVGDDAPKELRTAIQECVCCIFFTTRNSLASQWCLIETAAFWGAGKEVLPYLAEPDVDHGMLPKHLQNAHSSSASKAVRDKAAKLVRAAAPQPIESPSPAKTITVASIEEAIRRAIGLVNVQRSLQDRLLLVRAMIAVRDDMGEDSGGFHEVLRSYLAELRGFSMREIDHACSAQWPVRFLLEEPSGQRSVGYAACKQASPSGLSFTSCVILFMTDGHCDGVAIARALHVDSDLKVSAEGDRCDGNAGFSDMTLVEHGISEISEWVRPKEGA